MPGAFILEPNFPNPFNPSTTIQYQLPVRAHVILRVFSLLGQERVRLVDEVQDAGAQEATLDASELPSGVYIYRLEAGGFVEVKKLVVLK